MMNLELSVLLICMTSMCSLTQYTSLCLMFQVRRQPTQCRPRVLFNSCVDRIY